MTAIRVGAVDALWLVKLALVAASKDDVTPVLSAVRFDVEEGGKRLRATASDRYRVHTGHIQILRADGDLEEGTGVLLDRAHVAWLAKNARAYRHGPAESFVEIDFGPEPGDLATISVVEYDGKHAGRLTMSAPSVKGNFPPVLRLFEGVTDGELRPLSLMDPRFVADLVTLQEHRGEPLKFHTARESGGARLKPILVENSAGSARALIQPSQVLR